MTFKSKELQELVRFFCEYANNGTLTNKLVVLILIKNHRQKKLIYLVKIVFSIKNILFS